MRPLVLTVVLLGIVCRMSGGTDAFAARDRRAPEVGIAEHLGETLPPDTSLIDEQGRRVVLKDLITKPTILTFVYYRCTHTCPTLLFGLSDVLSKVDLAPGKDYSVISVSFDETETPDLAVQKKKDYIKATGKQFPEGSWRFLTADSEMIAKLTGAAGFGFKKMATGFNHPVVLIVLSPQGKITRYLYGVRFLPMDLTLALTEASKGLAAPTVNKLLLYCFSYDPEGKRYVFDVLKITAIATIFFIVVFIGWLTRWGRKRPGAAS